MIKLLKNHQAKTYDMMIDRVVIVNMNKTGISRNIPAAAAETEQYINLLTRRLKQEV